MPRLDALKDLAFDVQEIWFAEPDEHFLERRVAILPERPATAHWRMLRLLTNPRPSPVASPVPRRDAGGAG